MLEHVINFISVLFAKKKIANVLYVQIETC